MTATIAPVAPDPTRTFRALSSDDLRCTVPSVFAENAQPGVSSRYTFVSTAQVVELLHGESWEPVLARQQRVRLLERQGFQMHEVRFARRDDLRKSMFEVGDVGPSLFCKTRTTARAPIASKPASIGSFAATVSSLPVLTSRMSRFGTSTFPRRSS